MNQNIKPLTATFIILIGVSLISLIFWLRGESLNVGGADQIKFDPEGNVIVHVAGKLVKLSPDLELLKEYELAEFGAYDLVGDFDFFSDGDILIRKGKYQPGLLESVSRYFRKADTKLPIAERENEGLFRCKLDLKQCSAFGADAVDFDSAFHLSIDATDTVYLSDTSRHKLRKFDAQGHELAVIDQGVKFPNQNLFYNGKLWVADTNHHAIQVVDRGTENFGTILESHSILNPALKDNIWPYSFAKVGENWWVNNLNGSMSAGKITIYDQNWQFERIVELPQNADPFDFAVLKEQVLLSDFNNSRIYQLDYQGEPINKPFPQKVLLTLDALSQQRSYYINLSYGAVGLFIVFLMSGFALAIIQARTQEDYEKDHLVESLNININDPNIKWIILNKQKERAMKIGLFVLLLIPIISIWITLGDDDISLAYRMTLVLLMIVIPLLGLRLFTQKIGTLDDVLIIKKSKKEYAAGRANGVYYSDTQILIGDVHITFNQHQMFYDVEQVVNQLMPILRNATYVQPGHMMNMVIKRQKPAIIILLFFVAILSAGFIMLNGIGQ